METLKPKELTKNDRAVVKKSLIEALHSTQGENLKAVSQAIIKADEHLNHSEPLRRPIWED